MPEDQVPEPQPEPQPEPEPKVIPEDVLPSDLRGRSPEEVRAILNTAFQVLRTRNQELEDLRREMRELRESVGRGKREEEPGAPLEEEIHLDPKSAISRVVKEVIQSEYGPTISRLSESAETSALIAARRHFSDFDEYEDDVRRVLRETGAPPTPENIRGAYFMVRGAKAFEQEDQRRRAAVRTSEPPKPPSPAPPTPKLSDLEREFAEKLGLSEAEYIEWRDKEYTAKVPMGR